MTTKKAKKNVSTKKEPTPVEALNLEGKKAPSFKLKDKDSEIFSLSEFGPDYTVLFFYPKDNTPGCTVESISFSKNAAKFKKLGASVVGISGGDEKTKTKFVEKQNLKIPMLSDTDFSIAKKYKAYGEKSFMGRKYMGIFRYTFVVDKNQKVIKVFEKVKPPTHVQEVLDYLKEL